ncbi:uncharacterized protein LOC143511982 isoform X3 [Brachyhypopomus gauderio]|uniref:uncharacterized protein LOC143511982 isoform X3 n=1 Tax=Brachyhypopomus gauderio TaxID=698409 RepID=UPI0040424998
MSVSQDVAAAEEFGKRNPLCARVRLCLHTCTRAHVRVMTEARVAVILQGGTVVGLPDYKVKKTTCKILQLVKGVSTPLRQECCGAEGEIHLLISAHLVPSTSLTSERKTRREGAGEKALCLPGCHMPRALESAHHSASTSVKSFHIHQDVKSYYILGELPFQDMVRSVLCLEED